MSLRLRARSPCNKVPRMPDESPSRARENNTAKRGRPRGHRLSNETRLKIAETRQAQERRKREERAQAPLASSFPSLSVEMRRAVTGRDGRNCRSCGEDGPKLRVHSFLSGLDDLGALERDPELHAVMCSFCSELADAIDARSMASLLRNRW